MLDEAVHVIGVGLQASTVVLVSRQRAAREASAIIGNDPVARGQVGRHRPLGLGRLSRTGDHHQNRTDATGLEVEPSPLQFQKSGLEGCHGRPHPLTSASTEGAETNSAREPTALGM